MKDSTVYFIAPSHPNKIKQPMVVERSRMLVGGQMEFQLKHENGDMHKVAGEVAWIPSTQLKKR